MQKTSGLTSTGLIRLAFSLLLLLPAGNTAASHETTSTNGSFSMELLAPAFLVETGSDGWTTIQAEGFNNDDTPGKADLPKRLLQLALPAQADPESVWMEITDLQEELLPGTFHIQTVPPDSAEDLDSSSASGSWIAKPAATTTYAALLATGQMRKWRFVSLEHTPFAYDPASSQLSKANRMLVTIHYTLDPSTTDLALLSDDRMDELAPSKFYNYDQAQDWYPAVDTQDQPGLIYDYVIITTAAIEAGSTKLDDFILHKQSRGFNVLTITESEYDGQVGQSPNGTAEKIRQWLKDNYITLGIEYVLLVGNPDPDDPSITDPVGDVPMKMTWPRRADQNDQLAPTDYFFADLTGNWDKDGDGYFGEWVDDQGTGGVDFAAEVYVGRIPVYSANYSTLDSVLQKIMDYENEASPLSWRKQVLLPMSFSEVNYDGAPLAEQMKDDYLDGAGFSSWTQYQQGSLSSCNPVPDSIYISDEELRGGTVVRERWAANDYGLVLWWGHGSASAASVGYQSCWDGTLFANTQAASLDDDHPSFVYQTSCNNGYPEDANNLQYALLKHGAVATVSATRVSWFNMNVDYGEFAKSTTNSGIGYEYALRLVGGEFAAEALYNAKSSMQPEFDTRLMNFYDFNLYGDPTTSLVQPAGPQAFNKTSPLNGSTGQPDALVISWQPTSPVTRYEYCYDSSDDQACSNWTDNGLLTSASLSGLSQDTTYYWQVRALNGHANPTYADGSAWFQFSVGAGEQSSKVYLPVVMRSSPPGVIPNGDFEQGRGASWQEYSLNHYYLIFLIDFPHGGSWAARLGDVNNEYAELYQQVTISAAYPRLTFWYLIGSLDYCGYDFARVLVSGTPLLEYSLCQPNATGGWVRQDLDLSDYAGQSVELKFTIQTDSTLNSNFYIDDVSLGSSGTLSQGAAALVIQTLDLNGAE